MSSFHCTQHSLKGLLQSWTVVLLFLWGRGQPSHVSVTKIVCLLNISFAVFSIRRLFSFGMEGFVLVCFSFCGARDWTQALFTLGMCSTELSLQPRWSVSVDFCGQLHFMNEDLDSWISVDFYGQLHFINEDSGSGRLCLRLNSHWAQKFALAGQKLIKYLSPFSFVWISNSSDYGDSSVSSSFYLIKFLAFYINHLGLVVFRILVFQFFGHLSTLSERGLSNPPIKSIHRCFWFSLPIFTSFRDHHCQKQSWIFQSVYSLTTPLECQLSDNRLLVCLLWLYSSCLELHLAYYKLSYI